jgi:hypothetical protein
MSRRPLFDRVAAFVTGPTQPLREETYVLSARTLHSVRLRNHGVSVRHLDLVSPDGLELWRPTLEATFPLPARALALLNEAWGLNLPAPNAPCWSEAQLMDQLVRPHRELITVPVTKVRTPILVEGCSGEHVDFTVDGSRWESLSLENVDQAVVHAALESLGFRASANTSYTAALVRISAGTPV